MAGEQADASLLGRHTGYLAGDGGWQAGAPIGKRRAGARYNQGAPSGSKGAGGSRTTGEAKEERSRGSPGGIELPRSKGSWKLENGMFYGRAIGGREELG
jgi:hypothetical protein